jgi:lycopene cyclase domain-containing protein
MDQYQYLLLMAACLVITLPLEFVFGARVWRRPARLVTALVPVVGAFYVWDVIAIQREHWSFNPRYTTGVILPGGVPLEELVFFVVIPICALLSYEAVRNLLGHDLPGWVGDRLPHRLGGNA